MQNWCSLMCSIRILWLWSCQFHYSWWIPVEWNCSRQCWFSELQVWTTGKWCYKTLQRAPRLADDQYWWLYLWIFFQQSEFLWCKDCETETPFKKVCIYITLYTGFHTSISLAICKEEHDGYMVSLCIWNVNCCKVTAALCPLSYVGIVLCRAQCSSGWWVDGWQLAAWCR